MMKISSGIGLGVAVWVLAAGLAGAETKPAAPEPQPPAELVQKAEKGDAAPQRELGLFYLHQRSTDSKAWQHARDVSKEWLKKAAAQNDAQALFWYGTDFCGPRYALRDIAECLKWLGKAAALDVALAQEELGALYLYGGRTENGAEAVPRDVDKAMELLKKAAAKNHADAMYHLGYAYALVKPDPKASLEWYEKAAEMMDTRAMVALAYDALRGTPQMKKNSPRALALYEEAAGLFSTEAQFELAHIYLDGELAPKNYKKAADLFRQVDENFDLVDFEDNNLFVELIVDAKLHLGLMYRDGLGVEKDEKEAMHYFRQAERFDSPAAQYLIAQAYEQGRGVARDNVEAYVLYTRAKEIAFRPFSLEVIDSRGMENHPMPGLDAEKALATLAAKMSAKDLERARRYVAAEEHTQMQIESAQMWKPAP